jgi:type IV pilus assembly protein PilX
MSRKTERNPENGSALVMGIVFLLVLTLLAVVGMQTTILEEKMAGNLRDRELAFRAAETALRTAEDLLVQDAPLVFDDSDGLYQADPDLLTALDWTEQDSRQFGGTLHGIWSNPRYVIEEQPLIFGSANPLYADEPMPPERYYRILSRGVGGTESAVVILQSTYKR